MRSLQASLLRARKPCPRSARRYEHAARGLASAAAVPRPASDPLYPPASTPPDAAVRRGNARTREAIKAAKPFSEFLTDTFRRQHDYLRISVTERCNLRCLYCMPEEGVPLSPAAHLLTSPEIFYLSSLFVSQGVTKIRLTGGEPTVRRDIVPLMQSIGSLRSKGLRELCLTTNGISLYRKLDSMAEAGLTGVNLSLDTLDPFQFQIMTRRKGFDAVMKSIERILEMNRLGAGIKLKVNCVVMRGLNEREIIPFVEMGREKDIEVRFIEYMPFDGNKWNQRKMVPYKEMLDIIWEKYPGLHHVPGKKNDTSKTYQIPGFVGRVGFITSMTNDFCSTCNRLRITSDGNLKVCLHGNDEVSLRDVLREGNGGRPIDEDAFELLKQTERERWENGLQSDQTPLGWGERERKLLEVIGVAVKKKKEKHDDMGELENKKNRPMILIGGLVDGTRLSSQPSPFRATTTIPLFHLSQQAHGRVMSLRPFSSTSAARQAKPPSPKDADTQPPNRLPHLTSSGTAHMVSVTDKAHTSRTAIAVGYVYFSNPEPLRLIRSNSLKKGDALSVARIAGIMAAKKTPEIVPLCHPISLTSVGVELRLEDAEREAGERPREGSIGSVRTGFGPHGAVSIEAKVTCVGQTGVEMEALTAVLGAAATVYDMCKAVDKGMTVQNVRVVLKEGGKSGTWREEGWTSALER